MSGKNNTRVNDFAARRDVPPDKLHHHKAQLYKHLKIDEKGKVVKELTNDASNNNSHRTSPMLDAKEGEKKQQKRLNNTTTTARTVGSRTLECRLPSAF